VQRYMGLTEATQVYGSAASSIDAMCQGMWDRYSINALQFTHLICWDWCQ